MADNYVIKFLKKDTDHIEFAYFAIFDGHGGPEASAFCRDNLLNEIIKYDGFWTDDDKKVLDAIRKGFLDTHRAMWNVLDSWLKSVIGPCLAGTTATITIIKQGKLYSGHVGHSALVLGENDLCGGGNLFQAICITKDHKPDDPDERLRIEDSGGKVIVKSGVPRVVSRKPRTNREKFPTLAVARSLGDLWSFDNDTQKYIVSPDPDVGVLKLDPNKHRCLVLASDGLWNVLSPEESVNMVMDVEAKFEQGIINDPNVDVGPWSNSAEQLVSRALEKWQSKALIADNTSCVVVVIDTLQPSKLTLWKQQRQELSSGAEMLCQLNKTPRCPDEKFGDKNTHCSLREGHISVADHSMIQPVDQEPNVLGCSLTVGSHSTAIKESHNDNIDSLQSIQKSCVKSLICSNYNAEIESADSLKNNRHFLQRIPSDRNDHLRRLTNLYSCGSQNQIDGHVTEFSDNRASTSGNDIQIFKRVKKPWALKREMAFVCKGKIGVKIWALNREMTVECKVKDVTKTPWALRHEKRLEINANNRWYKWIQRL
ncbi:unnamed protein product [Lymnaea stagnalis]|uniref:PPM-type phosphatase domain-containing protein n=1 Tax=Lymnaea stagnalis TaxID=6523 RepID=A0AAV2H7F1_LYMST